MDSTSIFKVLENQYANKLPFVVYSRPINSMVKCWLQHDDTLHTTKTFSESGFVFAPFDLNQKSVLFPKENCEHHVFELQSFNTQVKSTNNSFEEVNKPDHIALVSKGIEAIKSGDLKKVVLSRVKTKPQQADHPLEIFKKLFDTYKNAMVYCWYHPKVGLWLGATPELLFKSEGKKLTTISLAGTQPYTENESPSWTTKESEEQQIVTDYIENKIQPYTETIKIGNVETVRAGNLVHLKTRITSRLKEGCQMKQIIEALHPTPAVCGFPKEKAKNFITESENYNREFYTGFLGELNLKMSQTRNTNRRNVENNAYSVVKTHSNFYVNLRCMQLKQNEAYIYVGGGITKDSDAEQEWQETVNKTKTIERILD